MLIYVTGSRELGTHIRVLKQMHTEHQYGPAGISLYAYLDSVAAVVECSRQLSLGLAAEFHIIILGSQAYLRSFTPVQAQLA